MSDKVKMHPIVRYDSDYPQHWLVFNPAHLKMPLAVVVGFGGDGAVFRSLPALAEYMYGKFGLKVVLHLHDA
jgi:hypothetical protein